jgi:hypothetical protein
MLLHVNANVMRLTIIQLFIFKNNLLRFLDINNKYKFFVLLLSQIKNKKM